MDSVWWAVLAALTVSASVTGVMRRIAVSRGIVDHPNERSSHTVPTPRGGGVAIVVATILLVTVLFGQELVDSRLAITVIGGGLLVAFVGFIDDRRSIPPTWRFSAHFAAAVWAIVALGGVPPIQLGSDVVSLGWPGDVVGAIAIVWVLNLFNFMDGIDGIAASEAVFVCSVAFVLQILDSESPTAFASLVVAASSFGFLLWNWPPAKIFLGDVGSGFLGYLIAVIALASARENDVMLFVWLILGGVFFVDASVTLARRALRKERVYQAHRSHAYQWLARRWKSHRQVTLAVWGVNLFWLLPLAWACTKYPSLALWIVGIALGPLVVAALMLGAGKPEA